MNRVTRAGGKVMRKKMPGQTKPVAHPVAPSGAALKKGGRVGYAAGGAAKIRHKQATSAGKPLAPKGRFTGKLI